MNLAEIRKKAQKEKKPVERFLVPELSPLPHETPETEQVSAEATAEDGVPKCVEETPVFQPQISAQPFNPLSVLMAGRRAAGSAVEISPAPDSGASGESSQKYLCFRVVAEEYAISLMDIKEIIKPRCITEVPHAPRFINGIISLRGSIMPIIDLRVRLGFAKEASTGRERFVIVKKGQDFCGLLVDEVYQVIALEQQPLEKPPAVLDGSDREFIKGIGRYGNRMFILMDLEKLLDINLN